jgi:hypothetical protein
MAVLREKVKQEALIIYQSRALVKVFFNAACATSATG